MGKKHAIINTKKKKKITILVNFFSYILCQLKTNNIYILPLFYNEHCLKEIKCQTNYTKKENN